MQDYKQKKAALTKAQYIARVGQVLQTTKAQQVAARIAAGFTKNLRKSGRQEGGGSQVLARSGAYVARALRMAQSLRGLCDVDARAPCDCLIAGARRQALLRKSRRARVPVCGARIVLGEND